MFERAGGRERLDLIDRGTRTAHEVFEIAKRLLGTFVVDVIEQGVVQPCERNAARVALRDAKARRESRGNGPADRIVVGARRGRRRGATR